MKKYLLLLTMAVALVCCQKDKHEEPAETGVDPKDPAAVTAAIKVYYGSLINAAFPSATAQGPQLLAETANLIAISGRYVVLKPVSSEGTQAGYYVRVKGASSYFKIDYSTPRGARKAGHTGAREQEDISPEDSALVIALGDIHSGELCLEYAAYDEAGNAGNIVQACINIKAAGGPTGLAGNWRQTGEKLFNQEWNRDLYNKTNVNREYFCEGGKLYELCPAGLNCQDSRMIAEYTQYTTSTLALSAAGGYTNTVTGSYSKVNQSASTCSNVVYNTLTINVNEVAGWTYSSSSKELIVLYDQNGEFYYDIMKAELSGNKLTITDNNYNVREYTRQ